ncbi:MAG: hypothetical protein RL692_1026, partial [Planctomycetota bacterium]
RAKFGASGQCERPRDIRWWKDQADARAHILAKLAGLKTILRATVRPSVLHRSHERQRNAIQ